MQVGVNWKTRIACAIGGKESIHRGRQRWVEQIVGEIVSTDPDVGQAGVVAQERAVGDAPTGEIAVGDDKAGVAEDGEVEPEGMRRIVQDGRAELNRERAARTQRKQLRVAKRGAEWIRR